MKRLLGTFLVVLFGVLLMSADDAKRSCLLVRPAERTWVVSPHNYEYVDSYNLAGIKLTYKKKDLESLQRTGVHVVLVQRNAKRDEVKQARESCEK